MNRSAWILLLSCIWGADARGLCSAELSPAIGHAIQTHCAHCHNAESRKGQLDLAEKNLNAVDQASLAFWIQVHDRVAAGEMPPPAESDWSSDQRQEFLKQLSTAVVQVDQSLRGEEGRVTRRRLNRYEYENTLRDLLDAPWLPIRQMLPEDGEAFRFNKVSEALDVSHVQIARYLAAADSALRAVKAKELEAPQVKVNRYYARDSRSFNRRVKFSVFNRSPERSTFPILGFSADLDVLEGTAPVTVGAAEPDRRAKEAMGVVASSYEPIEIRFDEFTAPESGRYKLRFNAFSFWAAPESEENWWRPSRSELAQGRTREPVSVYAEKLPRLLRKLGNFEVSPTPDVYEMEVQLLAGETIRPDAVRLFRSRPPGPWRNPLAERDGQPGVAFRWLEVEGPLLEQWPGAGHLLMFDDLPLAEVQGTVQVVSQAAAADAERLLRRFLARVYRQPVTHVDVEQFLPVIQHALSLGNSFEDAMLAGYSAVLCSPQFVTLAEPSGQLGDIELATRLAYFLWNSEPDQRLRQLAAENRLHEPEVLRAETERLLADGKAQRFVEGFLDYWLDLRKVDATSPDAVLYPDYYLDDYLVESAVDETRAFFAELIRSDLPARCIVQADFAMVNQRLAEHYGLADVTGVQIRKVPLPQPHVRGGLLTQASILKVTANGTTTSPVVRGAWITERILGKPIPPPPAAVPAVEPDTRGATTIREQLAKHRSLETCQGCHARIDPPGFALESFDVLGGWRQQYRVVPGEIATKRKLLDAPGFGKNGQPFDFQDGPAVDPSGMLPSGHGFQDIHDFRSALLEDERQIARNLVKQLMIYATGAEVRFSDRPAIEAVLDATSQQHYPVRELIQQIVTSRLFRQK